jgi:hypothetical protein
MCRAAGRLRHCRGRSISVKADHHQRRSRLRQRGAVESSELAANIGKSPAMVGHEFKLNILKISLQLFWEWLSLFSLLDNLSFQGMENLQVNVVQ